MLLYERGILWRCKEMMSKEAYYTRALCQLNFNCTKCGNCCRKQHVIQLTGKDIVRASRYLKISRKEFIRSHAVKVENVWYLKNMWPFCEFLMNNECVIYEGRPIACRIYPYLTNLHLDDAIFVLEDCKGTEEAAAEVIAHEHELSGDPERKAMESSEEFKNMEYRIIDKMLKREFA
jgi:Fe-S-cluster containining protein